MKLNTERKWSKRYLFLKVGNISVGKENVDLNKLFDQND